MEITSYALREREEVFHLRYLSLLPTIKCASNHYVKIVRMWPTSSSITSSAYYVELVGNAMTSSSPMQPFPITKKPSNTILGGIVPYAAYIIVHSKRECWYVEKETHPPIFIVTCIDELGSWDYAIKVWGYIGLKSEHSMYTCTTIYTDIH